MSDQDPRDGWRLVVLHPRRLLIWVNIVAATMCFGLVGAWSLAHPWTFGYPLLNGPLPWMLALLVVGGLLSLVAFIGNYLETRA